MSLEAMTAVLDEAFPVPAAGVQASSYVLTALVVADTVNPTHDHLFWASLPKVAARAKMNRDTVRRCMAALVDEGVIEVVRVRDGQTTEYRWRWFPPRGVTAGSGAGDPAGGPRPAPRPDRGDPAATPRQTQEEPNAETQPTTPISPASGGRTLEMRGSTLGSVTTIRLGDVDESFKAFWAMYPRHESRPQARAVWARMTVDQRGEALLSMMVWAEAYRSGQWTFIPYAVRWLREERWLASPPNQAPPRQASATEALRRVAQNDPRLRREA